jgi:hypothetical protein
MLLRLCSFVSSFTFCTIVFSSSDKSVSLIVTVWLLLLLFFNSSLISSRYGGSKGVFPFFFKQKILCHSLHDGDSFGKEELFDSLNRSCLIAVAYMHILLRTLELHDEDFDKGKRYYINVSILFDILAALTKTVIE